MIFIVATLLVLLTTLLLLLCDLGCVDVRRVSGANRSRAASLLCRNGDRPSRLAPSESSSTSRPTHEGARLSYSFEDQFALSPEFLVLKHISMVSVPLSWLVFRS